MRFALCSLLLPTIVSAVRFLKSSFSASIRGVALNAPAPRLSSTLFDQVKPDPISLDRDLTIMVTVQGGRNESKATRTRNGLVGCVKSCLTALICSLSLNDRRQIRFAFLYSYPLDSFGTMCSLNGYYG